jgi:hypothetical protein
MGCLIPFQRRALAVGFSVLGVAVLWTGCATSNYSGTDRRGEVRWCHGAYERVWEAAIESARAADLTIVNGDKIKGILLLRDQPHDRAPGEHIVVRIAPISKDKTSIAIKTDYQGPPPFEWSLNVNKVFKGIALELRRNEFQVAGSNESSETGLASEGEGIRPNIRAALVPGTSRSVMTREEVTRPPSEELSLEELIRLERHRRDEELGRAQLRETEERLRTEQYLKETVGEKTGAGENPLAGRE